LSSSPDLRSDKDAGRDPGLNWPAVRDWLQAHPDPLAEDRALLEELGLRASERNVIDFGRAALARLEAVVEREADARKRIEAVAQANFAAQTQTHAVALDVLEALDATDLARRIDVSARERFGLAAAALAVERPGAAPFGWKALGPGAVDDLLGEDGLAWLGVNFEGLNLFGAAEDQVRSVALIRMHPWGRPAICAFGSSEPEGFTRDMGCELAVFIARVVERAAETRAQET
jgi:uncharacterized protein YigA (DUF484 family)